MEHVALMIHCEDRWGIYSILEWPKRYTHLVTVY